MRTAADDGEAVFHHACCMELEGIVAKRRVSRYRSGHCTDWIKIQNRTHRRRPG
jgi:ATP-dependent DNA ligase